MTWVWVFLGLLGLAILSLVRAAVRSGPRQVDMATLRRGRVVYEVTEDDPGDGWSELGSHTRADGLRLSFSHDDDPEAEATLLVPGAGERRSSLTNIHVVRLTSEFQEAHVHTSGYVFRVWIRGTGAAEGKETRLQMLVDGKGGPVGGRIENDDDDDAAVGGWIEIERAQVLKVS